MRTHRGKIKALKCVLSKLPVYRMMEWFSFQAVGLEQAKKLRAHYVESPFYHFFYESHESCLDKSSLESLGFTDFPGPNANISWVFKILKGSPRLYDRFSTEMLPSFELSSDDKA